LNLFFGKILPFTINCFDVHDLGKKMKTGDAPLDYI